MEITSTASLLETAELMVKDYLADSKTLNRAAEERIPKFNMQEITLGKIIGRGGFCVVSEINDIKTATSDKNSPSMSHQSGSLISRLVPFKRKNKKQKKPRHGSSKDNVADSMKSSLDSEDADNETDGNPIDVGASKDFVSSRAKGSRKSGGRYVLKRLGANLNRSDKLAFLKGTVDLAMEAKFLAVLDHTNIIKLVGVSDSGAFKEGSFIVIEKLNETLSKRFTKWMNIDRQCKGVTGVFTGSKKKVQELYRDRIETAYDIASGAQYLHQKNIIFRDLVSAIYTYYPDEIQLLLPNKFAFANDMCSVSKK
jgi:serine/threonine protein kinase